MSLRDQACYTLELQPSESDPAVLELLEVVGGSKQPRYARVKEGREGEAYSSALYAAKLASIGYETDKAKKRRLQLHGPDEDVDLDFTGKLNFEWTIRFLGCKFRWTKEVYGKDYVCAMDRKPDPKVEICLARAPDKNESGRVQILHYNIERFLNEITDVRGLETLLVLSFLCFVDHQDDRWRSGRPTVTTVSSSSSVEGKQLPAVPIPATVTPPEPDYEPEDPNEIIVGLHTDMDGHIARACALLQDPKILFIVVRTRKAQAVQRALEASLGVKRWRHSECLPDLHQYVHEQDANRTKPEQAKKGPKVINLDDPPKATPYAFLFTLLPNIQIEAARANSKNKGSEWKAPQNIAIYLSKIELPDLDPNRRRPSGFQPPTQAGTSSSSSRPAVPPVLSTSTRPPKPTPPPTHGKNDEPAKLSKKPNKVFSNPFTSSQASSTPTSASATAPTPAKQQSNGNAANNASPPAMPGGWAGSVKPPPPPPDASSRPSAASTGGGAGASGGGQRLSALQKLVQISRK